MPYSILLSQPIPRCACASWGAAAIQKRRKRRLRMPEDGTENRILPLHTSRGCVIPFHDTVVVACHENDFFILPSWPFAGVSLHPAACGAHFVPGPAPHGADVRDPARGLRRASQMGSRGGAPQGGRRREPEVKAGRSAYSGCSFREVRLARYSPGRSLRRSLLAWRRSW